MGAESEGVQKSSCPNIVKIIIEALPTYWQKL